MKRIVITLIISIAVFVATIVGTNIYVSQKSIETADYLNSLALDHFQSELNSNILLTEQSVRSFLTGISSFSLCNDSSTIVIDKGGLAGIEATICSDMGDFMKANKYYQTSTFIIDRDICRDYFHREGCFVPSIEQGDTVIHDLSQRYDFMGSSHYQEVKKERKIFWTTPTAKSPVAGRFMSMYVPLSLSDGRFFGAFTISLEIKMLNKMLNNHLPYENNQSAMFLVDESGEIFASSNELIVNPENREEIKRITINTDKEESDHQVISYQGKDYYIYQRADLLAPWKIITICETEAIYEGVRQFIFVIVTTSLIGILLILICSVVIFNQIKKNLRLKAAAEEELRMAARVQMSMLKPGKYASKTDGAAESRLSAFLRPAKEAGGDLYDYVERNGTLIFCIGDVSGKGMPAALFMAQVVSLFRNAVGNTSEPSEIVSQINNVLTQNNPDLTFCTFFVGTLCGETLQFCNAGHNPPVLIAPSPRYLEVKPHIALGLIEGFPYTTESLSLRQGDKLVLYTDGVTEAKNKENQQYGEERLLNTIEQHSAPDTENIIAKSIEEFEKGTEQSDDITVVVIEK